MASRDWRFVLTNLDSETLTVLDKIASDRKVTFVLNDESVHEGHVPSDSRLISDIADDGDPYLAMNSRLIYGFRRESDETPFWIPRFGGLVHIVGDVAESNEPETHYSAYDPWRLLKSRPLTRDDGLLPTDGLTFRNRPGNEIAIDLLTNTDAFHGTARIDYGQTDFYEGTIEVTDEIDQHFESSTSVGEAWTQLTDGGTLDIVLDPIYDPVNRPGFLAELSVYAKAGDDKPNAIFAWDKPGRSLTGIERVQDGTAMANKILFYTGNGTPAALQSATASIAKYGQYWLEKSISDEYVTSAVQLLAQAELRLRRQGKTTLTIDPTPIRAPEPFRDYYLGDRVPVYASNRLRLALENTVDDARRVYGIPIVLDDDGAESIDKLLISSPFEDEA